MTTVSGSPEGHGAYAQVASHAHDGATVVVLRGEVDVTSADPARSALSAAQARGCPVVVDVSEVTFADSSALNLLLWANRRMPLYVAGPLGDQVRRLLDLTGAQEVLALAPTREDALRQALAHGAAAKDPGPEDAVAEGDGPAV